MSQFLAKNCSVNHNAKNCVDRNGTADPHSSTPAQYISGNDVNVGIDVNGVATSEERLHNVLTKLSSNP